MAACAWRKGSVPLLLLLLLGCCVPDSPGQSCETRDDCEAGEACVDGACRPGSTTDGDLDSDVDGDLDADSDSDVETDEPDPLEYPDTDGDGISDLHEGLGAVDTDGDGTPDTIDLDSDGDGIPDAEEAGDDDPRSPPRDTDRDGIPDFRDLDSDGDGIPDGVEGLGDPDGDGVPSYLDDDSDGDGIGDVFEGRADPDGDGVPSYLDDDSDGDGVPDLLEGGRDPAVEPPDSDGDGTPDFLDLDSDDDTIPDSVEGGSDPDGDGLGSFRDPDADGDGVPDWLEAGDDDPATPPVDTDGDRTPDYLDGDSDGDTIRDYHEYVFDTDGDGTHDLRDLDSDGDGLGDAAEAGDADPATPPVDTDGDGLPDFRDTDSDNDGLSDHREAFELFTDHLSPDTDGDGVTDLIEVAAGTNPRDAADNPRARGDFVFLEPYEAPPDPPVDTLSFSTDIQMADVYFLVDCTGSMGGEITNLRASLSATVIPGILAAIPDVWFGVGRFEDYPYIPYGDPGWGDRAYEHLRSMTASAADAQSSVNTLATRNGYDIAESDIPALHAMATGCGDGGGAYGVPNDPAGACTNPALIGYPHFRLGAVPIVVLLTDAPMHNGPDPSYNYGAIPGVTPPTYLATVAALRAIHARVIGVNSGTGRSDLEQLARATGTVSAFGVPYVYDISSAGTGLGAQVITAVEEVSGGVPMDITAYAVDDPSDGLDAVLAFVDRIVPNTTAGAPCAAGLATTDHDGDGVADTFVGVVPGTVVCFDIVPRRNETVRPTEDPQTFMATVQVWGDHVTVLDERDVYFLVPPVVPGSQ